MKDYFPDLPAHGKRRSRHLTEEEHRQWQEEHQNIKPLPKPHLHRPKMSHAIKIAPLELSPALAPSSAPLVALEQRLKQKLLRGRIDIDAKLDLHGYYQEEAHERLIAFLIEAQRRQNRIILVVTGKGNVAQSDHPHDFYSGEHRTGILRRLVPQWLRARELRGLVIGFEEAGPGHGGSGALYVRIRRQERNL